VPEDCEDKLTEALRDGIPHNVLNAKYHEMEAKIISEAGRLGVVTIATNMAGRGVDIILGGKVEGDTISHRSTEALAVVASGGLHIIGSERHESRRIDNQLRGRSGRQGDPGSSRFYCSMEDYLWRLFGDKSKSFLLAGWREDQSIDSKILSRLIERAQKKFEEHNFEMRKHVLEYDDVMNVERDRIYKERRKVLEGADLSATIMDFLEKEVAATVDAYCASGVHPSEWDTEGLFNALNEIFPVVWYARPEDLRGKRRDELQDFLLAVGQRIYQDREREFGSEMMRRIERHFMLDVINRKWREHLANMDFLQEGIGLRGYAGVNPIYHYAKEADELFHGMLESIREDVLKIMYRVQVSAPTPQPRRRLYRDLTEGRAALAEPETGEPVTGRERPKAAAAVQHHKEKVGRNDPCPCGSGKKYKKCCLLNEE
jgi:preprotein translocase subunit SecA